MPIDYSPERWNRLKENTRAWWKGELKRPLIQIAFTDGDPGRPPSKRILDGVTRFTINFGDDTAVEDIIDAWDYDLCKKRYIADSHPQICPNFGAGVVAGFLGAIVEPTPKTVWFHPPKPGIHPSELHFKFDPDNRYFHRINALYRAALDRWQGNVLMAMTDLGGTLDILASHLGTQELLLYLLTEPDEIKRLIWEIHEIWFQYYDLFNATLQPRNSGYGTWASIYSDTPTYMLQCDFAYNIGPEHFAEFVVPELGATCRRLKTSMYHLDGVGQLPHLDQLLAIPELDGIQWVSGANGPDFEGSLDVYGKVLKAGKRLQLLPKKTDPFLALERLQKEFGAVDGVVVAWNLPLAREAEVREQLEKWGVEE